MKTGLPQATIDHPECQFVEVWCDVFCRNFIERRFRESIPQVPARTSSIGE